MHARPNVVLEGGAAILFAPKRTIIVKMGDVRVPSDFSGMMYLALDNETGSRTELATLLHQITNSVDRSRNDYLTTAMGGDFVGCLPTHVRTQSPFAVEPTSATQQSAPTALNDVQSSPPAQHQTVGAESVAVQAGRDVRLGAEADSSKDGSDVG